MWRRQRSEKQETGAQSLDTDSALAGPGLSTELAGYRVVRRLASGRSSDLYVGQTGAHPSSSSSSSPSPSMDAVPSSGARTVVLKVFRARSDPAVAEREIRVLSELPTNHLAELRDLATLPDGRLLVVLERLPGPALANLPMRRVEVGELVTILAPLVQLLGQLHQSGWAHGSIRVSSVVFGVGGIPVLLGLGSLTVLPGPGEQRQRLCQEDCRQLGLVVQYVVDKLGQAPGIGAAADMLSRWCAEGGNSESITFLPELERRLFALAPALPVQFDELPERRHPLEVTTSRVPGFAVADEQPLEPVTPDRLPRWCDVFALPAEVHALIEKKLRVPGRFSAGKVRAALARKKRPLTISALVTVTVIVIVLTFLPLQGAENSNAQAEMPAETRATPHASSVLGGTKPPGDLRVLQGDDPVAAVGELLRLRADCFAEDSVLCLASNAQQDSAVLVADSFQIRLKQQGAARPQPVFWNEHSASLVEQTGNSAIVALVPAADALPNESHPASVLVVKGEAGWRLREIFEF